MSIQFSIVIPIYNAGLIVEHSVTRIMNRLDEEQIQYEILLGDDGSRDDSRKRIELLRQHYKQIRCFYNEHNKGLGLVLRKLFNEAQGEIIIYMDCDLPFKEEIILKLLEQIKNCDVAVVSRYKGVKNRIPFIRRIASRCYYCFCWILFRISVIDIGSGTVAIKRNVIETMDLKARGFDIHAELFVKAQRLGFKIEEIPAQCFENKLKTFSIMKHSPSTLWGTIQLLFRNR